MTGSAKRKFIITGLVTCIIIFAAAIILLFGTEPHTHGRAGMILTAITAVFAGLSFAMQLKQTRRERNDS
jgi:hypothetical protein